LKPSLTGGILFPKLARTSFVDLTRSRYDNMCRRMEKKKLPPPPFDLEQFRADVTSVMGGNEDGVIVCRYCKRPFTLQETAVDHATPLSRGGSAGLENLDYPCRQCNNRKGSLTLDEYTALLVYLDTVHPLARQDVLSRLEKANALAAGARRAQMLLAKNGKPAPAAKEEDGLGPF
jgi:HNH endonuclease